MFYIFYCFSFVCILLAADVMCEYCNFVTEYMLFSNYDGLMDYLYDWSVINIFSLCFFSFYFLLSFAMITVHKMSEWFLQKYEIVVGISSLQDFNLIIIFTIETWCNWGLKMLIVEYLEVYCELSGSDIIACLFSWW